MEYRETPRIAATDGRIDGVIDDAAPRPRFRRFEFVRSERHLDLTRVVLVGGAFLVAISLLGYLGIQGLNGAIGWLHRQPQYQVRFQDIQLQHPPPSWFRGGTEAFLKQVRDAAGEAEVLPVLELKEKQIKRDFQDSPWVEEVKRIEYPPQGIKVHLAYKTPVAVISYARGEQIILDRAGAILPLEDVDTEKLGPRIKIVGTGLAPSAENRAGKIWKSSATGPNAAKLERSVLGAARLAGFLFEPERAREASNSPALRILTVIATDRRGEPDGRGLFIQNAEDAIILWGDAPGEEKGNGLAAEEKWEILKKWGKSSTPRTLPPGDYWAFPLRSEHGSRTELRAVDTRRPTDR
jgi:hypothetical protein